MVPQMMDNNTCYESLEQAVMNIIALKPEVIFLTQTSATVYGWIIKEALITATGSESLPTFFTIDVRDHKRKLESEYNFYWYGEGTLEDLKGIGEFQKKVDKVCKKLEMKNIEGGDIVVFDETEDPEPLKLKYQRPTTVYAMYAVKAAQEKMGNCGEVYSIGVNDYSKGKKLGIRSVMPFNQPYIRCFDENRRTWTYRMPHTSEERRDAINTINKMKELGRKIGENIKTKCKRCNII
jgi:hypothetical protein